MNEDKKSLIHVASIFPLMDMIYYDNSFILTLKKSDESLAGFHLFSINHKDQHSNIPIGLGEINF